MSHDAHGTGTDRGETTAARLCQECGAEVFWNFARPDDRCPTCEKPIGEPSAATRHFWPLWLRILAYRIFRKRRDAREARETLDAWFDHVKECDGC